MKKVEEPCNLMDLELVEGVGIGGGGGANKWLHKGGNKVGKHYITCFLS